MPLPIVALPWGSRSTSSTRILDCARPAARLTLVVVFPTPPFWLVTARMRVMRARSRQDAAPPRALERRRREIGRDTSELQSRLHLVCRLLLEKKKKKDIYTANSAPY